MSKHLQTAKAPVQGFQPDQDHSPLNHPSHSTCTAGKALGKTYGVAKNAKLIAVQLGATDTREIIASFYEIEHDLLINPERRKRSVITMSLLGPPNDGTSEKAQTLKKLVSTMMNIDVPVVIAAGNEAPRRPVIDSLPGIWAAPDFPILVIGSTNKEGQVARDSQGGEQVFLHAVGEGITYLGIR